jgi:hypothetical protein
MTVKILIDNGLLDIKIRCHIKLWKLTRAVMGERETQSFKIDKKVSMKQKP